MVLHASAGASTCRVLLVDDSPDFTGLIQQTLGSPGAAFTLDIAGRLDAAIDLLRQRAPDVVLLELGVPDSDGLDAFVRLEAHAPGIPIIILTTIDDEALERRALQLGAQEYLVKSRFSMDALVRTIHHAIARSDTVRALRARQRKGSAIRHMKAEAEQSHLAAIVESSQDAILSLTMEGNILSWNKGAERLYGYSADEMIGQSIERLLAPNAPEDMSSIMNRIRRNESLVGHETVRLAKGGTSVYVSLTISPLLSAAGSIIGASTVAHDISSRKAAEEAQSRLVAILEATPDLVSMTDPDGRLLYLNPAGRTMLGLAAQVDLGTRALRDFLPNPATHPVLTEGIPTAVRVGSWSGETEFVALDGREISVSQIILTHRASDGRVMFFSTIARDITERKRLERQFLQAQKMEAVGQLAGGVAHDFNNLLTAIIGFSALTLDQLPEDTQVRRDIEQILRAGQSAATLTRQLLAFSRQQLIQPQILALDAVVSGLEGMLRRLISEDINLVVRSAESLGMVSADRGQIEQVVMNLVVNARDAMPTGGNLTIETANVELDAEYTALHPGMAPGTHVMIAVTDTGCGMDETVRARIFEPFFSTKARGTGTGLGLSTVYGIVQQNSGSIWVSSEPGAGSTFKVYLPQADARQPESPPVQTSSPSLSGAETILLVEDQPDVRSVTREILHRHGYTVLEASYGQEAADILGQQGAPVDLLLTDVVLPGMSGRQVAERLTAQQPGLSVLYMSGYTDDAIIRHGILGRGLAFLEKPFTAVHLLQKVRESLDHGKVK